MATESPLIHDGSQCVAAADYLTTPKQFYGVYISASRTVTVAALANHRIYGILQNTPESGQAADVGILGVSKAVAGAALSAGAYLTTDSSGRLVTATTGQLACAQAITDAGGADEVFTVFLNPGLGLAP